MIAQYFHWKSEVWRIYFVEAVMINVLVQLGCISSACSRPKDVL